MQNANAACCRRFLYCCVLLCSPGLCNAGLDELIQRLGHLLSGLQQAVMPAGWAVTRNAPLDLPCCCWQRQLQHFRARPWLELHRASRQSRRRPPAAEA